MHRIAIGLAGLLFATPAAAQMTQYWLPNGPGGTTYNNPQGSLSGTYYNNALRRHADQHRWARQRQPPPAPAATAGAATAGIGTAGAATHGAGMAGRPQAAARDPSFRLSNTGGRTVREVYVSPASDSLWGPDRLGAQLLAPGARLAIRLPVGQCVNDIRVVFLDGTAQERRGVDTCGLTDIRLR